MTCILIDDEQDALVLLQGMIQRHTPFLDILGLYQSGAVGVDAIRSMQPDLVFLDVEMPDMDGFSVLEACREIPFQIIFTTAYNEYAVKAFKYSAIGYLLKPVDEEDMKSAVERTRQFLSIQEQARQRDRLFELLKPHTAPQREKIALPASDGIVLLDINEILYCKADGNYTHVYLIHDRKAQVFTRQLIHIEALLPKDQFYRSHKSYLLHLRYVESYSRINGVKMKGGYYLPVSDTFKAGLLDRLGTI